MAFNKLSKSIESKYNMSIESNKTSCSAQCTEMLTVSAINAVFSQGETRSKEIVAGCFYSCWYHSFLLSAKLIYNSYSPGYVHEMADTSFTDAMLDYIKKATSGALYQSTASARSIAFSFFTNKLHESIRNDKTRAFLEETSIPESRYAYSITGVDQRDHMLNCLEKIKPVLSEEDIAICNWKFSDRLSNSDIATLLNITTDSFTNRFYRLTGRMEKLIASCLKSLRL